MCSPKAQFTPVQDDSCFGVSKDMPEAAATQGGAPERTRLGLPHPRAPLSDQHWKEHLSIKGCRSNSAVNAYADELAAEMKVYCLDRLENVASNIDAIIKRLQKLKRKNKKPTVKKEKHIICQFVPSLDR